MEQRTDNEVFAEFEESYLKTRSQDAFWNMYLLIHKYEKRLIRKYCRKNNLFKSTDDVNDLAGDMALWFIKQYERPDFRVQSMSSYGWNAFLKIMFAPNRKADELRQKAIDELPEANEQDVSYELCEFETITEKKERWHWEKVAKGHSDKQGILPFEEWEPKDEEI